MKKYKLKESTEFAIASILFCLLMVVMTIAVIHRFDYLQQQKSADITARNQVVNN